MKLFLAISWFCLLAIAMLTPGTRFPEVDLFDFQDKVIHLISFFIQGYLWSGIGVKKSQVSIRNPRIWQNYILFGILAGIVLELLQQFIPFRSFEIMDMIVNVVGVTIGMLGYLKWPLVKFILE